jgi:thiol-disulfide isomerase/thioredoxin
VLDFFAVNCGYCIKQIPRLETIRKTYAEKGIRFVNVQMKMGQEFSEEDAKKKMSEVGWGGELARDMTNGSGQKYGASGFPTMVIVGKNGKIEAVNVGNIGDLETKVAAQLDAILAGKPASSVAAAPPAAPPTAAAPPGTPPAPSQPQAERPKRPAEELIGTQAPSFSLKTVDGKTVSSDEYSKHPAMVLNFVAPNCGYCKKQVPNLDKVRADYEAKGIRFVNVYERMGTKDFEPAEAIDVFKQAGSNLELARDTGNEIGQLFKATSYPTMVIIGKDGKIEHVNAGAKPDIEQIVKGQLDALIAKK